MKRNLQIEVARRLDLHERDVLARFRDPEPEDVPRFSNNKGMVTGKPDHCAKVGTVATLGTLARTHMHSHMLHLPDVYNPAQTHNTTPPPNRSTFASEI